MSKIAIPYILGSTLMPYRQFILRFFDEKSAIERGCDPLKSLPTRVAAADLRVEFYKSNPSEFILVPAEADK